MDATEAEQGWMNAQRRPAGPLFAGPGAVPRPRQRRPPWRKGSSKPSEARRPEKKSLSRLIACPAEKSCGHPMRFEKGVWTGSWGHERPR